MDPKSIVYISERFLHSSFCALNELFIWEQEALLHTRGMWVSQTAPDKELLISQRVPSIQSAHISSSCLVLKASRSSHVPWINGTSSRLTCNAQKWIMNQFKTTENWQRLQGKSPRTTVGDVKKKNINKARHSLKSFHLKKKKYS